MLSKGLIVREQIVKTVVKSGNGGAVWVPKDWLGKQVFVILPEKQRPSVKERVMHLLGPYLKDIVAVGIYGSHARNEQEMNSDIDVLVITSSQTSLKFKREKMDIIIFTLDKFKKAIENYPVIYYQIAREVAPFINSSVLEELKRIKINSNSFKPYLKETEEHLQSNRELLELDKMDGGLIKSYSVLYSSTLRLRGLFIIRSILTNKAFSNRNFKSFLLSKGLSITEMKDCYDAFRLVRDNALYIRLRIRIAVGEKLLNLLASELKLIEEKIYGKQEKKA